jgi:hypothetical protein
MLRRGQQWDIDSVINPTVEACAGRRALLRLRAF